MDSTSSTTSSPTTSPTGLAPHGKGRGLILFGAIGVALISTAAAYVAMVGYGRDVLAMGAINAYAFAGVFELSLVTVALMAREAAQQDRPAQTLLTLTWLLSAASGFFAGWHEIHLGHAATAAAFRFIVPLLAALMWHLALVGDRHLAMERSWSDLRMGARMHSLLASRVEWRRARDTAVRKRTASSRRKLERAQKRYWRAEAVALRSVAPGAMRDQITQWVDAFAAVAEGTRQADRLPITLPDVHEALSVPVVERVSAEQITDERSPAALSAHAHDDDERFTAHVSAPALTAQATAQPERSQATETAHKPQPVAQSMSQPVETAVLTSERSPELVAAHVSAQGTAHETVSAPAAEVVALTDELTTQPMSARPLVVSGERSATGERAHGTAHPSAQRAHMSQLRAVPTPAAPIPAGPERDAIVDAMLAADSSVTGVQVAERLGLADQSGRRELSAARKRANTTADAVNQ